MVGVGLDLIEELARMFEPLLTIEIEGHGVERPHGVRGGYGTILDPLCRWHQGWYQCIVDTIGCREGQLDGGIRGKVPEGVGTRGDGVAPDELLDWVTEGHLEFLGRYGIPRVLDLLDEVLVWRLGEPTALLLVQRDVVGPEDRFNGCVKVGGVGG